MGQSSAGSSNTGSIRKEAEKVSKWPAATGTPVCVSSCSQSGSTGASREATNTAELQGYSSEGGHTQHLYSGLHVLHPSPDPTLRNKTHTEQP